MLIVKSCLFAFGLFVVLLVVILVLGRGAMFHVRLFSTVGLWLIGAGLGTSVVGCGLIFLGRIALAHLSAHLNNRGPA